MKTKALSIIALFAAVALLFSCQPKEQKQELPPPATDMFKGNIEPYYFATTLTGEWDKIVAEVKAALKTEGFGVISTIDVQNAMKEKLDIDYKKYLILGACNPLFAYQALEHEDKIGTMLPCNVVIQEVGENEYEIAAVNPVASMMAIDNPDLAEVAIEVRGKLEAVVEKLAN
jgi:uncharacterized protein (DUF302 family)